MNEKYLIDHTESPFSKVIANDDHIKNVLCRAIKKCNTNLHTPISKNINIELRSWKKFLSKKYIKELTYYRLSKFCDFSESQIREGISYIDDINNPIIPLNFNCPAGVRMDVAVINEGRTRKRIVEYTNKDKEILDLIRECSKRILGENFNPHERVDLRDQTVCLSFPPYFAKHFIKIEISSNKNHLQVGVPDYILKNPKYHKIWWQGNLSEEASIYAFVSSNNSFSYVVPRIQINRAKSVSLPFKFPHKETTYYHKDLSPVFLEELKANIPKLIKDEAKMLATFGINVTPYFSKLYINKRGEQTATYSLMVSNLSGIANYFQHIGFELDRHRKQCELLMSNNGPKTNDEVRDIILKFYQLVPKYLRGNKKIKNNKWLTHKDKKDLLG